MIWQTQLNCCCHIAFFAAKQKTVSNALVGKIGLGTQNKNFGAAAFQAASRLRACFALIDDIFDLFIMFHWFFVKFIIIVMINEMNAIKINFKLQSYLTFTN